MRTIRAFAPLALSFLLLLLPLVSCDFMLRTSESAPSGLAGLPITTDATGTWLMIGGSGQPFTGFNIGGFVASSQGGGLYAVPSSNPTEPPMRIRIGINLQTMRITEHHFRTSNWAACRRGGYSWMLFYGRNQENNPDCLYGLRLEVIDV